MSMSITNLTARPWGLPELATSVRASHDDDDDDDDDHDDNYYYYWIFLILLIIIIIILVSSWNPIRNPSDCVVNCSMGPGDFDIFLKPYFKKKKKKPADCTCG